MSHINTLRIKHLRALRGGSSAKLKISQLPALVILVSCLVLVAALSGCASPGAQEYNPWQSYYKCPGCLPDCD